MNLKDIIMVLAVIVLTIFVTFYGINTIFPKPQYEDYCDNYISKPYPLDSREVCPAVCVPMYTIQKDKCVYDECGSGCGPDNTYTFATLEECEEGVYDVKCYERYDISLKERSRKVFFVALPLGILVILLGAFGFGLEPIGAGLMGGGVGTLIYGSGAFWPYTENWVRFFISLLGLIILIWFSYYFNKKLGKKK